MSNQIDFLHNTSSAMIIGRKIKENIKKKLTKHSTPLIKSVGTNNHQ